MLRSQHILWGERENEGVAGVKCSSPTINIRDEARDLQQNIPFSLIYCGNFDDFDKFATEYKNNLCFIFYSNGAAKIRFGICGGLGCGALVRVIASHQWFSSLGLCVR